MEGQGEMIDKPGIYSMTSDEYHRDPCPEPSLSSSIARLILTASPYHAWWAHPKLNPAWEPPDPEPRFDIGTAAHALLLEGEDIAVPVGADTWASKAAKDARDTARAAGKIPMLREQYKRVKAMVGALKERMVWSGGLAERVVAWKEGDLWFRARLDWLDLERRPAQIIDYKTRGRAGGAHPDAWARALFSEGYDIQEAFYRRAVRMLAPGEPAFTWVVQECEPPYAATMARLDPQAQELADRKVEEAIKAWRTCLERNVWPAYPPEPVEIAAPAWVTAQWEARLWQGPPPVDDGRPLDEQLFGDRGDRG